MSDDAELLNALIASARQDGERAWQLLARYREILCNLAERQFGSVLRPDWSASDLAHDTLLEVRRGFAGFHGTTEQELLAYLKITLIRNAIGLLRRKKRAPPVVPPPPDSSGSLRDPPDPGPSPSSDARTNEQLERLAEAMSHLPPRQLQAVVHRYLQGLPLDEIAKQMGCTTAAVGGLLRHGMHALRQMLKTEDVDWGP